MLRGSDAIVRLATQVQYYSLVWCGHDGGDHYLRILTNNLEGLLTRLDIRSD